MTWRRVAIAESVDAAVRESESQGTRMGLDVTASEAHSQFLSDLPHMSEVSKSHEEFMGQVGNMPESTRMANSEVTTIGEMVADLGGSIEGGYMEIPMPSANRSGIFLEVMEGESGTIARIIAPSGFGGFLRTFSLPTGSFISDATWNGHTLGLSLDDHS
ncbi:MAG: hypothetical protein CMB53_02090 [Euryarchaeota archaeon]|mgnify:FL=1|nr:hypothetical protein [Euryarchaeota archaeon]|tara:strand:+ start:223 stop:702 length:480 start_codon:yes stop_codon:yes gene_type:complete